MSHTWPDDLDIILVSPGGQKAYVMSDNGTGTDIVSVNLTFDDTAAAALTNAAIVSGTYKPSNYQGSTTTDVMPAPAPAGPYGADFSGFTGLSGANLNGTWSLYVRDDVGDDTGSIAGGWTLTFVAPPVCSTSCAVASADLSVTNTPTSGGTVNAGSNITYSFVATNLGPDAADAVTLTTSTPANTTFVSASPSAGATLVAAPAVGGTGAVTYTWLGSTASAGTRTLGMVVNVNPGTPAATVIGSSVNASSTTGDPSGANNVQLSNVTVTAPVTAPPMLTSFTPSSGAVGTLVTLTGLNLSGTTDVKFNGTSAAFTPISATQVKATVPAGATTGPIAVTNALGTGTTAVKFTVLSSLPRIVTFSPTSGTTGTVVTISGANLSGTTAVLFNGTAAAFTQISATQVKATVPAGATTGPISITTPFGTATTGTVKFTKF